MVATTNLLGFLSCTAASIAICFLINLYRLFKKHAPWNSQVHEVSFWLMKYGSPSPALACMHVGTHGQCTHALLLDHACYRLNPQVHQDQWLQILKGMTGMKRMKGRKRRSWRGYDFWLAMMYVIHACSYIVMHVVNELAFMCPFQGIAFPEDESTSHCSCPSTAFVKGVEAQAVPARAKAVRAKVTPARTRTSS